MNRFFVILFSILLLGCSVQFNMTGAKIPDEIKTIRIETFVDESGQGPAEISLLITESLKQFFQTNTQLKIVNPGDPEPVDLVLTGQITGYVIEPVAVSNDGAVERASQNRLVISVNSTLENVRELTTDAEVGYENKVFRNNNALFDSGVNFTAVESELVDEALEQIVQDMFTSAFNDW